MSRHAAAANRPSPARETTFALTNLDGPPVTIRKVLPDAHWRWLADGWRDFWAGWRGSMPVGIGVALFSMIVVFAMWRAGLEAFIPAACGGFALVGPLLATSVYEVSRRLDDGETIDTSTPFRLRVASPAQVGFIGFALMFALLVWARIATLLYALATGAMEVAPGLDFMRFVLQTPEGAAMAAVGTLVGATIAAVCFAISVVSIPLCAARKVDAMSAMMTSFAAVARNPGAMGAFAFNIAILTAICLVTGFAALAIVFPWLGHATWRAYRSVIDDGIAA